MSEPERKTDPDAVSLQAAREIDGMLSGSLFYGDYGCKCRRIAMLQTRIKKAIDEAGE